MCRIKTNTNLIYGVNAHLQNGIAKRAIRDLLESTRKQLLHTRQCWPKAVSLAVWPYALQYASHLNNILLTLKERQSKQELFSRIWVGSNMHAFGCPVFAL
jgi:hypothetical protein